MDNSFEFIEKIKEQIEESEEEFIYKSIAPYCETIVEKRLSKKELEKILRKGMQPSIPLDKIKKARKEIEQNAYPIVHGINNHDMGMTLNGIFQVLDKLIEESEGKNDTRKSNRFIR